MALNKKPKNILKFSSPSRWWGSSWREALVCGNGIIGCSVLGGAAEDSIMLTHSDLWWQGKVGVLPEVCDNLKKAQKLIDEGKFEESESIIPDALIGKGYRPQISYPLPLADFKIRQKCDRPPKDYSRSVNLDNGEITVGFKDGATRYQRSLFVFKKDDLVVFEISKAGNKAIDVEFTLEMHEKFNNRTPNAISNLPSAPSTKTEGKFIFYAARGDNGLDFGAVAYINFFGGTLTNNGEWSAVTGAEKVFIIIRPFINVKNREIRFKEIRDELKNFKLTYDKLLKEHSNETAKILGKTYLSLGDDDSFIDRAVSDPAYELRPSDLEKLWAYGRHLFISATTPCSAPISPYGIWCGDYKGVDSHINADGSLQLMYEHALAGNLTEYLESLLTLYENSLDDLKKNAIRLFDVRGIMVPSVMARGTGLIGLVEAKVVNFTGAAGWLAKSFYDCCLCTKDAKLLKARVVPFIKETAQFYMEFFKPASDSYFESSPSYSPLSERSGKNALIDFAIAKQVFKSLIEISEELGIAKAETAKWEDFLTHIPAYRVNADGTIKEYFDNRINDNYKSGSTALFYPLFPGSEINETSGEIYKAYEKTAQKRFSFGAHQTSATLMRFANIFVRLNQPQMAEDIITAAIRHTAMGNLIFSANDWTGMGVANPDIWATYSIESNLMLTNAIQEMFVRSDKNNIWLLPCSIVNKGELGGFLTKAGVEIDEMEWDTRKGQVTAKLKAKKAVNITLRLPSEVKKYKGPGTVDAGQNSISNIELPAGKIVALDIKL